jgi:hypothetical protein
VIQAMGDCDGDGNFGFMAASSLSGAIYNESSSD